MNSPQNVLSPAFLTELLRVQAFQGESSSRILEQICLLLALKLIDEEEPSESPLFPRQASRYRFSRWQEKAPLEARAYANEKVLPYMASVSSKTPFESSFFQNCSFSLQEDSFGKLLQSIGSLQLAPLTFEERQNFTSALVQPFAGLEDRRPSLSPLFRRLLLRMAELQPQEAVFDPFCGFGELFLEALSFPQGPLSEHSWGLEPLPSFYRVASFCKVFRRDKALLRNEVYSFFEIKDPAPSFHILFLVSNVDESFFTFSSQESAARILFWAAAFPPKSAGRMFFVLPKAALSSQEQAEFRRKFLSSWSLHSIVELPLAFVRTPSLERYLLLYFEKSHPASKTREQRKVWFYRFSEEEAKYTEEAEECLHHFLNFKRSGYTQPTGNETDEEVTLPQPYWWTSWKRILGSSVTFDPSVYRPFVRGESSVEALPRLRHEIARYAEEIRQLTLLSPSFESQAPAAEAQAPEPLETTLEVLDSVSAALTKHVQRYRHILQQKARIEAHGT